MKKIYLTVLILTWLIAGCATNQATPINKPIDNATLPAQAKPSNQKANQANIDTVLKQMKDCINALDRSPSAKLIDGQVLALDQSNPNAKALFSSSEKLTDAQISAMAIFKRESQACRQISNQLTNPNLRKTFQRSFAKLDRVYDDLIYKKITIGVANQERALLLDDFRLQWQDEIKKQQGK